MSTFARGMRAFSFIFGLFYLLSIAGYGLEFHYCLGQITDVNHALLDTSCHCDDAHQGLIKGCCEEREFFVQLDQDHETPPSSDVNKVYQPLMANCCWDCLETFASESKAPDVIDDRGPPIDAKLYKEHCALILYS